jgi:outer membrane protein assembly factor BamB
MVPSVGIVGAVVTIVRWSPGSSGGAMRGVGFALTCCGLLGAGLAAAQERVGDWPQWGGRDDRNMVSDQRPLPAWFVAGKKNSDGTGIDLSTTQNVKWAVKLGSQTYSNPTVARGRVFIGTNDYGLKDPRYEPNGGGLLKCLDEATGRLVWQLIAPRLIVDDPLWNMDQLELGICSSATIDGDRVYLVTNRCDVLCLDINGMADGNDGPFIDEGQYMAGPGKPPIAVGPTDADILWRYDLIGELSVWPHDAANCSVLVHGDLVYTGTSNGVDRTLRHVPSPQAPSLIALDKRTGRLVAQDGEEIGRRLFHGQWSSPSLAKVGDKTLIFFGGGDGRCYAFEALDAISERPVRLRTAWSFDCNPPEYRFQDGQPVDYVRGDVRQKKGNKDDGSYVGPSEIIATPVCVNNRVYVATGQDPLHGRGKGALHAIDATQTGNITTSGKLWSYTNLDRSLSTVAVADGLLYIADLTGMLQCLDAETGHCYWTYRTGAETWASPFVADGKIYLGTQKHLYTLTAGRQTALVGQTRLGSACWCTPITANGVLFVASERYLWAVRDGREGKK